MMTAPKSYRHLVALLVCATLLWQTAAPSLAFGKAGGQSLQWMQICTAYGIHEVAVADVEKGGESTGDGGKRASGASCPLCVLQVLASAVPTNAAIHGVGFLLQREFSEPIPPTPFAVPRPEREVLPRGPPVSR